MFIKMNTKNLIKKLEKRNKLIEDILLTYNKELYEDYSMLFKLGQSGAWIELNYIEKLEI